MFVCFLAFVCKAAPRTKGLVRTPLGSDRFPKSDLEALLSFASDQKSDFTSAINLACVGRHGNDVGVATYAGGEGCV